MPGSPTAGRIARLLKLSRWSGRPIFSPAKNPIAVPRRPPNGGVEDLACGSIAGTAFLLSEVSYLQRECAGRD